MPKTNVHNRKETKRQMNKGCKERRLERSHDREMVEEEEGGETCVAKSTGRMLKLIYSQHDDICNQCDNNDCNDYQ